MRLYSSIRLFVLVLVSCCPAGSFAQEAPAVYTKNNIKLNLFSLPMKNISLQYERGLNDKMSVALGLRLQPRSSVPFQGTLRNSLEDDDTTSLDFVNNARVSSWAITPEFRYYFGKKPLNGFYIAPFLRVGGYSLDWNYAFHKDDGTIKDIKFKGNMTTFGGGILFGAQWHFGKHILLDWWILGPMFSTQTTDLKADTDLSDLSAQDQSDLLESLQSVEILGNGVDAQVNNSGASVKSQSGLPGLRTGLCIGFTF